MPVTPEELERWLKLDRRVHRMSEQTIALAEDALARGFSELALAYTTSVNRWTDARERALAGVKKKAGVGGRPEGDEKL